MMITTKKVPQNKKEFAQTMVEFALVFPLLLVITYGIMEFGRMLFMYTAVTSASREGARYAATALNYKSCAGIREATQKTAFLIPSGDLTISYFTIHGGTTIQECNPKYTGADLVLGDRVRVQVIAHYSPIIPLPGIGVTDINRQSTRTLVLGLEIDNPWEPGP